jgi:CRISPR-associated endonuclease/helicase Cas3
MVLNLIYLSHPDKKLEDHIRGVVELVEHRSSNPFSYWAALFHDIGKINPNFQAKLKGQTTGGYSNHSYLSLLAFTNFALANIELLKEKCSIKSNEEFALLVLIVSVLIGKHHGNLPNLEMFSPTYEELNTVIAFVEENIDEFLVHEFIVSKLNTPCDSFSLSFGKKTRIILTFTSTLHAKAWKESPLRFFMDTQDAFSALIESDKRDAGNNNDFYFKSTIDQSITDLRGSLCSMFESFDISSNTSELNKLRTEIRLEAVKGVSDAIQRGEHIFTLTAPTGAGKTFSLLAIADEIRKNKESLGIIYALPFLSITEQVEGIAKKMVNDVLSVNSKAENDRIEKAQLLYEVEQSPENLSLILKEDFIQNTFDHPFIITTFVQLFETLVSNRNSTLLKLPNFANRIFLIDEVQALPPRLYIFFTAWLDEFCKRNNSFAVISTATMPKMAIPIKLDAKEEERADLLFSSYKEPQELIDAPKFFNEDVFNRYRIDILDQKIGVEELTNHILGQENACLVILNTIADTKNLYDRLKDKVDYLYLLNTHFIPDDRSRIIDEVKKLLKVKTKVILVSTQLIEAGVDIDFPVVYRDLCPLPSLIQSAGRCNRNKSIDLGQVFFFQLVNDSGKSRAHLIYRNEAKVFLDFCLKELQNGTSEKELFKVQAKFFEFIKENLSIGDFAYDGKMKNNMVECVNRARFETLGKFKLIHEDVGEQVQFYILKNDNDCIYRDLEELISHLSHCKTFSEKKKLKIELNSFFKSLSGRIISIRMNSYNKSQYPTEPYRADIMGIKFIENTNYSHQEGLIVNNVENCFL